MELSSLTASVTLIVHQNANHPNMAPISGKSGLYSHQRIGLLLLLKDSCCSLVILCRLVSKGRIKLAARANLRPCAQLQTDPYETDVSIFASGGVTEYRGHVLGEIHLFVGVVWLSRHGALRG
jgi:hypothetical protein